MKTELLHEPFPLLVTGQNGTPQGVMFHARQLLPRGDVGRVAGHGFRVDRLLVLQPNWSSTLSHGVPQHATLTVRTQLHLVSQVYRKNEVLGLSARLALEAVDHLSCPP